MLWILASGRKWTSVSFLSLALIVSASISISCNRDPREPADANPAASGPPGPAAGPAAGAAAAPASTGAAPAPGAAVAPAARPRIVVLGDSLSAGLGLAQAESFPARLQRKIDGASLNFEIVNAGLSGDTSAGGVRRLDWSLDGDVRILILELGANDGLRGLSVAEMTANLSTIIERAQARGIAVLLCGMEAPPNFGASIRGSSTRRFRRWRASISCRSCRSC